MTQQVQNGVPSLRELIQEAFEDKDSEKKSQRRRLDFFWKRLELSMGNLYPALAKEANLEITWDDMYKEPVATFHWCDSLFIIRYMENDVPYPWNIVYKGTKYPHRRSFREGKYELRIKLLLWLGEIEYVQQNRNATSEM